MKKNNLGLTVSTFLFMQDMSQSYLIPMLSMLSGNLNRTQIKMLRELRANKRMNLTSLAQQLSITNQAITTISNTLVRKGYVMRIYDEANRRQIELEITPEGLDYVNQNEDEVVEILGREFAHLSEEDLEALRRASDEIYSILNKTTFGERYGKKKEYEIARRERYFNNK